MGRLVRLVGPLWGMMALAILAGIAGHLAAIAVPTVGLAAVLSVAGFDFMPAWGALMGVLAACAIARGVLHYLEQTANHYIAFKLLARIRHQVFAALRRLAPAKLAGRGSGDLISVITGDIELLEVFYAHTISPVAIALGVSLIVAAVEVSLHPVFGALAVCAFAVVGIAVPVAANASAGAAGRRFRDGLGALDTYLLDSLRGLGEAMQYGVARDRGEAFFRQSAALADREAELKSRSGATQAVMSVVVWVFDLVIAIVGLHLFYFGHITLAHMLIATVLLMSSFGPVLALASLGTGLQQTFAAGERVLGILDEEPAVAEVASGETPDGADVAVEGVSFSYGTDPVLTDISCTVPEDAIVGLAGKSGSGKSTLLSLIMRFWDVDQGRIAVGAVDVRAAATHALRQTQSLVTQDTHLFNESLADNIRIGRLDATDAEVEAAARAARIHDVIAALPDGYATRAGELGDVLSAGEKQRIGLARAFLRAAPLLLLDEPTSNLDSLNEAAIMRALVEGRAGRTVVIVSHRPSTLTCADTVITLDGGRLS
ncbi:ABC transporter ATP-binding protein [Collinsella sp. An268]|nr:ABC transporter ATP-binding protein [Collinsella sp. An268]